MRDCVTCVTSCFSWQGRAACPHRINGRANGLFVSSGREVEALTDATAAIQNPTAAIPVFRRFNKSALGPVGDSLDDLEPAVRLAVAPHDRHKQASEQ